MMSQILYQRQAGFEPVSHPVRTGAAFTFAVSSIEQFGASGNMIGFAVYQIFSQQLCKL